MVIFRLTLLVLLLGRTVRTTDGQPCVVGSLEPIVATSGDDVILPCHLEPSRSVEEAVVEWSRQDPSHIQYVHVYRDHDEVTDMKAASYRGRTVLFKEELKHGNISLKIIDVSPADEGSYKCFIPTLKSPVQDSLVRLIVKPNLKSQTEFPRVPPAVDPESPTTDEGETARGRAHLAVIGPFALVLVLVAGAAVFWKFHQRNTRSRPLWPSAGSAPAGTVQLAPKEEKSLTPTPLMKITQKKLGFI